MTCCRWITLLSNTATGLNLKKADTYIGIHGTTFSLLAFVVSTGEKQHPSFEAGSEHCQIDTGVRLEFHNIHFSWQVRPSPPGSES